VYRPQVTSKTTDGQLWDIMCNLIEPLNDSHTVLYWVEDKRGYTSGYARGKKAIDEEFSLNLVKRYLENFTKVKGEDDLGFGKIKNKNVGYIYLREEHGNDPTGAINHIITEFQNYEAVILDLRTNDGGDKRYSKIIAGGFSDGEHLVATSQTRNGPKHSDFDKKVNEMTQRTGSVQFLKPVVLLTDRATISGGEYLTLHMKTFAHVTQIGDTTAGDFSAVGTRSFLPNGWSYQYSIQMLLLPDGRSLDGIGIAPDIYIKNTKNTIEARTDVVVEKALQFLAKEYGIE
jgi:C-terminal processing protease CtpA/Prc